MKKSDSYLHRLLHNAHNRRSSEKWLLSGAFGMRISRTRPGGDLRGSPSSRGHVSPVSVSFPVCVPVDFPSVCLSSWLWFYNIGDGAQGSLCSCWSLGLHTIPMSQTKLLSSWWLLLWECMWLSELGSLCTSHRFADTWLRAKSTQNQTRKRAIFSCGKPFRKLYF